MTHSLLFKTESWFNLATIFLSVSNLFSDQGSHFGPLPKRGLGAIWGRRAACLSLPSEAGQHSSAHNPHPSVPHQLGDTKINREWADAEAVLQKVCSPQEMCKQIFGRSKNTNKEASVTQQWTLQHLFYACLLNSKIKLLSKSSFKQPKL